MIASTQRTDLGPNPPDDEVEWECQTCGVIQPEQHVRGRWNERRCPWCKTELERSW